MPTSNLYVWWKSVIPRSTSRAGRSRYCKKKLSDLASMSKNANNRQKSAYSRRKWFYNSKTYVDS